MVIYQSSSMSLNSGGGGSTAAGILDVIASTFLPSRGSGDNDLAVPSMNTGLSLQRRSTASLGRAALGWTTTVAISILIVQWIGNKDKKKTTPLDWIARAISQLCWSETKREDSRTNRGRTSRQVDAEEEEMDEQDGRSGVLLRKGSCHCGSITFKLIPARRVKATKSPQHGKLNYPTAKVPSDQLHLISGKHLWNTYHFVSEETNETWAYSFCKQCAIHLLHATDADQSSLFVNLQCFNVELDQSQRDNGKPAAYVPIPADGDSVVTRSSVISTVTAATQKSQFTSSAFTALPDYANPRTFGQQQHRASSLVTDDSTDANSDTPVSCAAPSHGHKLPRGVISYSPSSSRSTHFSTPRQTPSPFNRSCPPTMEWPHREEDEEDDDDEADHSISSHSISGEMDYFSACGNTAATANESSVNSVSSGSAIDYNVTVNRERMLQNMRKHLSGTPTKSTTPTTS